MDRTISTHYAFGGGTLDGRALARALADSRFPAPSIDYAASGVGVYTVGAAGLVADVEGHAIVDHDSGTGYEAALGLGYALVNLGYAVRVGTLRVFPIIGVGAGGLGVNLTAGQVDRADASIPIRGSKSNFLLHIGLGADWRIGSRFGLLIGLRLGYLVAPFSRREGIHGPYFRILLGVSG